MVFGPIHEGGFDIPQNGTHSALLPGQRGRHVDLADHFIDTVSILAGIRAAAAPATTVLHAPGCGPSGDDRSGFPEAVDAAARADATILVLGGRSGLLPHCTSGEAVDRATLGLPGVQQELLEQVAATGTPVVVVLVDGRPLALTDVVPHTGALLLAWLPGEEGGNAVADVLFGHASPGGRLPVSLPRSVGQVPLYYNHKPSGARSQFHGDYRDVPCSPLFPFGHGLSYGRFTYRNLQFSSRAPDAADVLEVSAEVANVGERAGDEVVQLYVRDLVARVTRPVLELKGFVRVSLGAGDSRRVTFRLDLRQLAYHDVDMRLVVEPGEVEISVGGSSADLPLRETLRTSGTLRPIDAATVRATEVSTD
jgi:beta-glucosidase